VQPDKSLAQIAYEAHLKATNLGPDVLTWEEINSNARGQRGRSVIAEKSWSCVAEAVEREVLERLTAVRAQAKRSSPQPYQCACGARLMVGEPHGCRLATKKEGV
jgi:hypothetical protein